MFFDGWISYIAQGTEKGARDLVHEVGDVLIFVKWVFFEFRDFQRAFWEFSLYIYILVSARPPTLLAWLSASP